MFGIGMTELVVIFAIALLVLGPKRLPSMARTLGRTLGEFRRASTDLRREFLEVAEDVRIEPPPSGEAPEAGGQEEEPEAQPDTDVDARGERPENG